jgi:hypothetical protein
MGPGNLYRLPPHSLVSSAQQYTRDAMAGSLSFIQTMTGKTKTSHSSMTITEITAVQLGIDSAHMHTPLYFGCFYRGHTGT